MEDLDWGNKKSEYYERNKSSRADDNYIEEEEEAIKIQQAKLKKLKEANLLDSEEEGEENTTNNKVIMDRYDLNSSESEDSDDGFITDKKTKKKGKQTKKKTASSSSTKAISNTKEDLEEQIQILKNSKIHITEIEENIKPVLEILKLEEKESKLKIKNTKEYLESKEKMHLLYTVYMLFYIYFKNQGKISEHHPVFKKMFYLKRLIDNMKETDENVFQEIDKVLKLIEAKKIMQEGEDAIEEDENMDNESRDEQKELTFLNKKRANPKDIINETKNKMEMLKSQRAQKEKKKQQELEEEIDYKNDMGKRMANEQILKARGIFRKRKKYQGNTKLHLREKYHKKQKERKNYVKEYEGKPEIYGGESTGIRRDLIRSTKFK